MQCCLCTDVGHDWQPILRKPGSLYWTVPVVSFRWKRSTSIKGGGVPIRKAKSYHETKIVYQSANHLLVGCFGAARKCKYKKQWPFVRSCICGLPITSQFSGAYAGFSIVSAASLVHFSFWHNRAKAISILYQWISWFSSNILANLLVKGSATNILMVCIALLLTPKINMRLHCVSVFVFCATTRFRAWANIILIPHSNHSC